MKLGIKISVGFAAVLLVLSVVLGISINALRQADKGISKYQDMALDTNLIGIMQADMLMVRMSVKGYLIAQSESDMSVYRTYFSNMLEYLSDADKQITDLERKALIGELHKHADGYKAAFDKVVGYMTQRKAEYDEELVPHGETMRQAIAEIILKANEQGNSALAYHAALVQEKMLTGRLFAVKYYQSGNIDDFKQAIEYVDTALNQEMSNLLKIQTDSDIRDRLAQFDRAHAEYVEDVQQIHDVTTTRDSVVKGTLIPVGEEITAMVVR